MPFDPDKHKTQVKGQDYLEVKWRLVWFREEKPDWSINTEFKVLDMDQGVAVSKAYIKNQEGRIVSEGSKTEYKASFFDFVEKAETGAIGRALAHLGYGTQFAPELEVEELGDGNRLADSPVDSKKSQKSRSSNKSKNGSSKQDKNKVVKDINMMLELLEWENGTAQEILKDTTGKESMRDCNTGELKKYRSQLKDSFVCMECKEDMTLGEIRYCYKNDLEMNCQDCQ